MRNLKEKVGPAFPFNDSVEGVLGIKDREQSIRTSIALILTTPVGRQVYNPNFGSYVPELVFDLIDDSTINLISFYVVDDLERNDPRIKVTSVEVNVPTEKSHTIEVLVGFRDRDDEAETQLQAPVTFRRP